MISRRMALRAAGATLWLPFLPSAAPRRTWAAAPVAPKRLALAVLPNGLVADQWEPATTGAEYALTPLLQPFADLRARLLVLSGVENLSERDSGAMHAQAMASLTTDVPLLAPNVVGNGISVDQVYAEAVGDWTPLRSLQVGVDNGALSTDGSLMYDDTLSWAPASTPLPPELDPAQAFARMFGLDAGALGVAVQTTVLDRVLERSAELKRGLSEADRLRLDQYETGVRELEQRLALLDSIGCTEPAAPAAALPFEAATEAMYELVALALQCDLTRAITFLQGPTESYWVHRHLGITETHHVLSHVAFDDAGAMADLLAIQIWELERFAAFVARLADTPDVDGSDLLANTLAIVTTEFGQSNLHLGYGDHGLPTAIAGGENLGVAQGRHLRFAGASHGDLWLAVLAHLGVPQPSFGAYGRSALDLGAGR